MSVLTRLRAVSRLVSFCRMSSSFQEISVPVPWGIISGKAWGNKDGRRVLGLHGWLHNANTFDRLAPLLPKDIYFVCIDFPGHGRSSHKPPGGVYAGMERVLDMARVIQHLEWEKFSILGHSLGGVYGTLYAGFFPEKVFKLVMIDTIGQQTFTTEEMYNEVKSRIPTLIRTHKPPKIFPDVESTAQRMVQEDSDLLLDSARIIVERGTRKVDGGVVFTLDYMLKSASLNTFQFNEEDLKYVYGNIKSSVLVILGLKSKYLSFFQCNEEKIIPYFKTSENVEVIGVEGDHNLHLNDPLVVVPHINNFLGSDEHKNVKSML